MLGWINRLFVNSRRNEQQASGVPDRGTTVAVTPEPPATVPRGKEVPLDTAHDAAAALRFSWHGLTDRGSVRPRNEDSFSCVSSAEWSLFVVADGMGGHDAGDVASRIAVETVCREIGEGMRQGRGPVGLIEHAVQQANVQVSSEGELKGSNMGTTVSLALLTGSTATIANVGDSRVYWTQSGALTQVTQDHSLVASLVTAGELTKEGARYHPRSNVLYRTVGRPESIAVDTFQIGLNSGDMLLLCTDGLWGMLGDERIGATLEEPSDARSISEKLVALANAAGGRDNITAVVVKIT